MAKLERQINGDFDVILDKLEDSILHGSITANLEDISDYNIDNVRCSVRVFERYSYTSGNRLSLTVTLLQVNGGIINVSAITAGGSNAMFFKFNKIGENTFLSKLDEALDEIERKYSK